MASGEAGGRAAGPPPRDTDVLRSAELQRSAGVRVQSCRGKHRGGTRASTANAAGRAIACTGSVSASTSFTLIAFSGERQLRRRRSLLAAVLFADDEFLVGSGTAAVGVQRHCSRRRHAGHECHQQECDREEVQTHAVLKRFGGASRLSGVKARSVGDRCLQQQSGFRVLCTPYAR